MLLTHQDKLPLSLLHRRVNSHMAQACLRIWRLVSKSGHSGWHLVLPSDS